MNHQEIEALHKKSLQALNNNEVEKAHGYLVRLLKLSPDYGDAYFLLAMVNIQVGQIAKAVKLIEKALSFDEKIEYKAQLAKCFALLGELNQAKLCSENIDDTSITDALTADTFGVALSRVGLHEQALKFFKQAIKLNNRNAAYHYNYGVSCKFSGDFTQAATAFESAITLDPEHTAAHYALCDVVKLGINSNHIERLLQVKEKVSHPDEQLQIGHALAREYEALNDYENAFNSLNKVKVLKKSQVNYDFSGDQKMFKVLQQQLNASSFKENTGFDDNSAIFVVGMPRTGTTVVERMLSQASGVCSLGELQDFAILVKQLSQEKSPQILNETILVQAEKIDFNLLGQAYIKKAKALSNNQTKFVDKMPLNILYSQLILTALPNAKIICLDRNPLDTIMSNFRQLFASNFSFYHYSLDLKDTYNFYKNFKRLAEQYVSAFPNNFLMISYEHLVANPQVVGKNIFDFCHLNWKKEYVLIENNLTPVSTASAVQVRQPITSSSVGNWRNYQEPLSEIIALMKSDGLLDDGVIGEHIDPHLNIVNTVNKYYGH